MLRYTSYINGIRGVASILPLGVLLRDHHTSASKHLPHSVPSFTVKAPAHPVVAQRHPHHVVQHAAEPCMFPALWMTPVKL